MNLRNLSIALAILGVCTGVGLYATKQTWSKWIWHAENRESSKAAESVAPPEKIIVTDLAQKNLGISAKFLKTETFRRTITVPGMVVDRPGVSDRGVVAPASGEVSAIHHVPGDTVRPGDVLFTIRLLSESLQLTQMDLRKAAQDIRLTQAEHERLSEISTSVPATKLIEIDHQLKRLQTAANSYAQELLNRGFSDADIKTIRDGGYVSTVQVVVPPRSAGAKPLPDKMEGPVAKSPFRDPNPLVMTLIRQPVKEAEPLAFEVQELRIDLGQPVQAGQLLCTLANHQALSIEGKAFTDEIALVERTFKERWPVDVEFSDNGATAWEDTRQTFFIRSIANTIDPANRTFSFLLPLENQSKPVAHDGPTKLVWRYRPGQKARLHVRVEEVKDVFVLPADAVVRDGAEAYVFTQNVNTFERKSVVVLFQERGKVVIANDGSLATYKKDKEGSKTTPKEKETWTIPAIAQAAAAQLHRMGRSGSSGIPKGYHMHADGSLHKNEDEGK
jgi:multidrug efflux pump subunit AcrA (membrane-fusion protein)